MLWIHYIELDPDPRFWPNLEPDPGLYCQFWKNAKNSFGGKKFFKKTLAPEEIFSQLVLRMFNLSSILHLLPLIYLFLPV